LIKPTNKHITNKNNKKGVITVRFGYINKLFDEIPKPKITRILQQSTKIYYNNKEGYYKIPLGEEHQFTLIGLLRMPFMNMKRHPLGFPMRFSLENK
jgi:hypothetical protein